MLVIVGFWIRCKSKLGYEREKYYTFDVDEYAEKLIFTYVRHWIQSDSGSSGLSGTVRILSLVVLVGRESTLGINVGCPRYKRLSFHFNHPLAILP